MKQPQILIFLELVSVKYAVANANVCQRAGKNSSFRITQPLHGGQRAASGYGSGNDAGLDNPSEFPNRTAIVPWTVPEIENGKCRVVKLPNFVSLRNHVSNSERTSKVIVGPETEQPETEPQLSVTSEVVEKVRLI